MSFFRAFLIALWLIVIGYTAVVISNHGMGLLPIFFGDMAAMTWPGQFNLDFMFMLSLSALWVSWPHQFSVGGSRWARLHSLVEPRFSRSISSS